MQECLNGDSPYQSELERLVSDANWNNYDPRQMPGGMPDNGMNGVRVPAYDYGASQRSPSGVIPQPGALPLRNTPPSQAGVVSPGQAPFIAPVPPVGFRPSANNLQPAIGAAQSPTSGLQPVISDTGSRSLVMRFGNLEEVEIAGRYDLGEQIGRGASAIVYEAWRKIDRLHVVIKVLQTSTADEDEAYVSIKRFYREAELISSLKEEHIVQCVDYGKFNGVPCMVLDYVDGLALDKFLAQYGALPLVYATGIIEQLLQALVETHKKGIIHRDIKPGNIMVYDSPPPYTIRVLDFGISSVLEGLQSKTLMTQTGNVRGTPSYMAPELFTGETRASIESDLYAVGLVYLECLTGEVAVSDKSFMRVAYKQVNEALEVPGFIPSGIADVILKLCAKAVNERYHSAQDVLNDIRAALPRALREEDRCLAEWNNSDKQNFRSTKSSLTINMAPQKSSKGRIVLSVILLLVLLGALGGGLYYYYLTKNEQLQEAENRKEEAAQAEEAKRQAELEAMNARSHAIVVGGGIEAARLSITNIWTNECNDVLNQIRNDDASNQVKTSTQKKKTSKSSHPSQTQSPELPADPMLGHVNMP